MNGQRVSIQSNLSRKGQDFGNAVGLCRASGRRHPVRYLLLPRAVN